MSDALGDFPELLARARRGDRDAVDQLARQYEAKVRLVARVLLGSALRPYLDSLDLVQSVHRSLMAGLRQQKYDISSPERLISLTLTMLRRKVARHWRHLQRQQRLDPAGAALAPLLASLANPLDDPARAAQTRDAVEHLWTHVDESDRDLLERRLQGYNSVEIGAQLGTHPVAVRVRLARLRQRLTESGKFADWV
jgi:RNA polymerase sigma-70 factor (ECF subfamily)